MLDTFFYVGLPYLSVFILVVGSVYRFRAERFSYSALSSQMLESRILPWGSIPWHFGILLLVAGHITVLLLPGLWMFLTLDRAVLLAAESLGVMLSVLCVLGLTVLLLRRVLFARMQAVSTAPDIVVLLLLIAQVILGLAVALGRSWGSVWAAGTLSPYLTSLLTLQPDMSYVEGLPAIVKFHLVGAWLIFALVPFTRLVHAFFLPFDFLLRAPQKVVWVNTRRLELQAAVRDTLESRRAFLRGALGTAAGGAMLGLGAIGTAGRYLLGPSMTPEEEAEMMAKRVRRLKVTETERELELERMRNSRIRVAGMAELASEKGIYFIDYQMRPALAFRGPDGMPLLISAKCTHLGCTIQSAVESGGRILCPCHMSYFDLVTGTPSAGSPATEPLPRLGWLLVDSEGKVVASRNARGEMEGQPDPGKTAQCTVFIAKQFEEEAMS